MFDSKIFESNQYLSRCEFQFIKHLPTVVLLFFLEKLLHFESY